MPLKKIALSVFIALFFLMTTYYESFATVITPPERRDHVDIFIKSDVQYDPTTKLYTYSYTITSLSTSKQEIDTFAIEVEGEITNILSPKEWDGFLANYGPVLFWVATGTGPRGDEIPEHNNISPSPVQIKPGETLAGFSFQSPEPPLTTVYYAQGFALLPEASQVEDLSREELLNLDFTENSKTGFTVGPGMDDNLIFAGGKKAVIDGILGIVAKTNRETRNRPVKIIIRFSKNGGTIETPTFKAILNFVDVTASFHQTGNGSELLGVFDLGDSPLVVGRNILKASIDGIVGGTIRTETEEDTFTFFVK